MRRPLAFVCALIVLFVYAGTTAGLFPIGKNSDVPDEGAYITLSGCVEEIYDNYIVIKDEERRRFVLYFKMSPARMSRDGTGSGETLKNGANLKIGEGITACGEYASFSHAMNPGQFDAYDHYSSKGYTGSIRNTEIIFSDGKGDLLREGLRRLRERLRERIYKVCPEKHASVMCGLLLGEKEGMDDETKELYQNTGIAHILSISSLHISILGIGLFKILRKLRCRVVSSALIASSVLVFYCIMTGMSVSAIRATGMFVIRMYAYLLKRTEDPVTSLFLMAAITAVTEPSALKGAAFMLSYGSALAIYLFLPSLKAFLFKADSKQSFREEGISKKVHVYLKKASAAAAMAFVSNLGIIIFTLPVQLYFFYRICIWSVFLNLLILPCMSLLVFSGMLMLIPGFGIIGTVSCILLDLFELLCRLAESMPFFEWNPGRPGSACIAAYYLIAFIIIIAGKLLLDSRKGRIRKAGIYLDGKWKKIPEKAEKLILAADSAPIRPAICFLFMMTALMLFLIRFPLPKKNTCTQLYIGQGNCNVMITDAGEVYIFDAGSSSLKNTGEYILKPYLKYSGLSHIDGIFISHSDSDHVNACLELLENMTAWGFSVDEVFITNQMKNDESENTERLLYLCDEALIPVRCIKGGDEWKSGSTCFSCLHPSYDYKPEDPNAGSMCILAVFCEKKARPLTVLIPGDVQGSGEEALMEELRKLANGTSDLENGTSIQANGRGGDFNVDAYNIDVYITAHHGSAGSSSEEFLDTTSPRLAINSAGEGNRYGHPSRETLSRLEDIGCAYLTTYETGAVTLDLSGDEVKISLFCDK